MRRKPRPVKLLDTNQHTSLHITEDHDPIVKSRSPEQAALCLILVLYYYVLLVEKVDSENIPSYHY